MTVMQEGGRTCTRCGVYKESSEFYVVGIGKRRPIAGMARLSARCRACLSEIDKAARREGRKTTRPKRHDRAHLETLYATHGLAGLTRGQAISAGKYGIIPEVRSERERQLRFRYKMTLEDYDSLLEAQGGLRAICREGWHQNFYVDHNHDSGVVRGLLCASCNTLVGVIEKRGHMARDAVAYLAATDEQWAK